jgi:hypothetical protein
MKFLYTLALCVAGLMVNAQNLKVLDAITLQPVSFASVLQIEKGKLIYASYADEDGRVNLKKHTAFDTVIFSCVGYRNKKLKKENIYSGSLVLSPIDIMLEEVVVSRHSQQKDTLIGEFSNKFKKQLSLNKENQFSVFFENTFEGKTILNSFLLKVSQITYKTAIRIHFYNKLDYKQEFVIPGDSSNKLYFYNSYIPNDDFLQDNIIVYLEPKKNGVIEVDVKGYNIMMPANGVFVAIECLAYYDEKGMQLLTVDKPTTIEAHYTLADNYCIRYGLLNNSWININKRIKTDYQFVFKREAGKKFFIAPTFGLKVVKIDK